MFGRTNSFTVITRISIGGHMAGLNVILTSAEIAGHIITISTAVGAIFISVQFTADQGFQF